MPFDFDSSAPGGRPAASDQSVIMAGQPMPVRRARRFASYEALFRCALMARYFDAAPPRCGRPRSCAYAYNNSIRPMLIIIGAIIASRCRRLMRYFATIT